MIFSGLHADIENREIQAELLAKTELSDSFTRLLLQDATGQALYCWLEGEPWTQQARRYSVGARLTLGPYRHCKVPMEYADFYSPSVSGVTVSDSLIHYPPNDASVSVGLTAERSQHLPLKQAIERSVSCSGFKCEVVGVVVDLVQRDTCNDRLWRIKLSDESLNPGEFLNVHIFVRKQEALKPQFETLGDVVVLQGCTFQMYQGRPQAAVNKNSDGWGLYRLKTGELMVSSSSFKSSDFLRQRVEGIRKWAREFYERQSLCNADLTVPRLGQLSKHRYKKVDVVGKVVRLCKGFPPGMCTILLCDESGFAFIECFDFNFEGLYEGCWAKARQVKVESTLRLDQYSSVVPIPEEFYDVKVRMRGADLPGMTLITREAVALLQQRIWAFDQSRERLVTHCQDDQIPLWSGREAASPLSARKHVRVKGLFVSIEPRNLKDCYFQTASELKFGAVLRCLCEDEVIEVLVSEKEAKELFGLRTIEPTEDVFRHILSRIEALESGNNWVEFGLSRVVWDNRVLLKLHRTSIVA